MMSSINIGKRNRLLIRQSRIKRDSDSGTPESLEVVELDELSSNSFQHSQPTKIDRHASEPAPNTESSTSHLLSVPQSIPFLTKQHSHPLMTSQSSSSTSTAASFTLYRQLSQPASSPATLTVSEAILSPSSCVLSTNTLTHNTGIVHLVTSSVKQESCTLSKSEIQNSSVILVSESVSSPVVSSVTTPISATAMEHTPSEPTRVKSEELQRASSSSQVIREATLENPRSSHCPVIRPGPALGCNFCWNTIDAHGRILRRKTKYHCPECQTNLCIVPCFQEYHERLSDDNLEMANTLTNRSKGFTSSGLSHFSRTGSM